MYAFHEQVHHDRLDDAGRSAMTRQLVAQRRARRRLARAERAALRARLVLAAIPEQRSVAADYAPRVTDWSRRDPAA